MFERFFELFNKEKDIRITHTEELIKEYKRTKKIYGIFNNEIVEAIKIIAQTKNWKKEIDEETLNLIEWCYQNKQEFLKRKQTNKEHGNKLTEYVEPVPGSLYSSEVYWHYKELEEAKRRKELEELEEKRRKELEELEANEKVIILKDRYKKKKEEKEPYNVLLMNCEGEVTEEEKYFSDDEYNSLS